MLDTLVQLVEWQYFYIHLYKKNKLLSIVSKQFLKVQSFYKSHVFIKNIISAKMKVVKVSIFRQCINRLPNPYFAGPMGRDCTRTPWPLRIDFESGVWRPKKRTLKYVRHSFIHLVFMCRVFCMILTQFLNCLFNHA